MFRYRYRNLKPTHPGVHPVIRLMHDALEQTEMCVKDVAQKAGFAPKTLRNWRTGYSTPTLNDLEAVFNAAGYKLEIKLKERA